MKQSIIWSVPSDFPFDDHAEVQLRTHLGLMFHGVSSVGAHTIGHRFLHDGDGGSLLLRVVLRDEHFVVQLVSMGAPDSGSIDTTEWMNRAEVAVQKRHHILVAPGPMDGETSGDIPLIGASGMFVRITQPNVDPLVLPPYAASGRFYSRNDLPVLYAASKLQDAWLEMLAASRMELHEAASGVPLRVSHLYLNDAQLLDLRTSDLRARFGFTPGDLWQTKGTQRIASLAREAGAEGLLFPSKYATDAAILVLFGHALYRVSVVETLLDKLDLTDAAHDPYIKIRLNSQPGLMDDFVRALESERFEQWLTTLSTVDAEKQKFRVFASHLP